MTFGKLILDAYAWGKEDYAKGLTFDDNPFDVETSFYYHWADGLEAALIAEAEAEAIDWQSDQAEAQAATKH